MCSYTLLRTFHLFSVIITVLSDHPENVKPRSKRTVGLVLAGLSNFLNVHDEIQTTTPITLTTSAPNYHKRPPPPKVQKWPPLDFEITPYVLSLISAKKQPPPAPPTEFPTYYSPTEEPYYHAQVLFVPLKDLENHLNNQQGLQPNSNYAYNSNGQPLQYTPQNVHQADSTIRYRLKPEIYGSTPIQQTQHLQPSYHVNNRPQSDTKELPNSISKKKASLQQKDIDDLLAKLTSFFANPHDAELSRIAGNDVANDKAQNYLSFIDKEPRLSYANQVSSEKNKDLSNFYLTERMKRLQNNVNRLKIHAGTGMYNERRKLVSNSPVKTNVEIVKSVEPKMEFNIDPPEQFGPNNIHQTASQEDDTEYVSDQAETSNNEGLNRSHESTTSTYEIFKSLEFPVTNLPKSSNFSLIGSEDRLNAPSLYIEKKPPTRNVLQSKNKNNIPAPQSEERTVGQKSKNSNIQIYFSPSLEPVKNYEREDEIQFQKGLSDSPSENDDRITQGISNENQSKLSENQRHAENDKNSYNSDISYGDYSQGGIRYSEPLNFKPYNIIRKQSRPTQTYGDLSIQRNRQNYGLQKLSAKNTPTADIISPFTVNAPRNLHGPIDVQNPSHEAQVHFFLPEEESLQKPEQFPKSPVTKVDYEDKSSVDHQYQADDYYHNSPESLENFAYHLPFEEAAPKYPVKSHPRTFDKPQLPDDIHNELYRRSSRIHHNLEPPPAFDQDSAKSELHLKAVMCASLNPLRGKNHSLCKSGH